MGHFIQITNPTNEQQANQKEVEEQHRERDLSMAIGFRWLLEGIVGGDITNIPREYVVPALPNNTLAATGEKPIKDLIGDLAKRLKSRRRVLVGHNCLMDVMFLYKMVIGDLPKDVTSFTDALHDLVPGVIDTKFLASCYSESLGRKNLGEVEQNLR